MKEKKIEFIGLRVSTGLKGLLEKHAQEQGQSLSAFVENILINSIAEKIANEVILKFDLRRNNKNVL